MMLLYFSMIWYGDTTTTLSVISYTAVYFGAPTIFTALLYISTPD
jgi:hypothetical protein